MNRLSIVLKKIGKLLAFAVVFSLANISEAQIGEVIWQDDFDNLDNWMKITGNGSWGWGNGELEYYHEDNVDITEVPGEPGNNALRLTARAESGPGIVDQWGNPLNYTSGKVSTKARLSVKYGVIETRIRIPDLDLGGWPAFWLLGTTNLGWPRCGELDMMEMGHHQSFRDLHDTHNGGNGSNNSTVNQMVSANAIFYSDDAITPENPSGANSLSWDPDDEYCRPYYNYSPIITDRFLTYRLYWDDVSIRLTVTDEDVEYDLYTEPYTIDEESDEFNAPFYLIANLAIGGALTDAYNLGDPGSGDPVSMSFPAEMYVDYVKVMEWNGMGDVHIGPPEQQSESFGLFTDNTETVGELIPGDTAEIYVWEGTLVDGSIDPFEGENGISWTTTGAGWFGAGIMSMQPINLSGFGDGFLKFMINIPAGISFQIGIIDAWGNQSYVEFPANQTRYGLVRDSNWGQAAIPIDDIRGEFIDLRMLSYEFVILEVNGAQCEFALDDIYWDGGETGISDDESGGDLAPNDFALLSNFPNPFNPMTTISYNLSQAAVVELKVFDINGRVVDTLVNKFQNAGLHSFSWDAANVRSGIYFYQIRANGKSETRKCMLIK
jgi:beta-glucanase (GH16 family)